MTHPLTSALPCSPELRQRRGPAEAADWLRSLPTFTYGRTTMATYDGVVGIDEPALNQFVKSVYQAVHDEVLKGNVPVQISNVTVTSIDYGLASVPQILLTPLALVRACGARRSLISDCRTRRWTKPRTPIPRHRLVLRSRHLL